MLAYIVRSNASSSPYRGSRPNASRVSGMFIVMDDRAFQAGPPYRYHRVVRRKISHVFSPVYPSSNDCKSGQCRDCSSGADMTDCCRNLCSGTVFALEEHFCWSIAWTWWLGVCGLATIWVWAAPPPGDYSQFSYCNTSGHIPGTHPQNMHEMSEMDMSVG